MHRALALIALVAASPVAALTVADFALVDHRGVEHRLYAYSDAKAVVLMVQGNGCPVVRNALTDLRAVRERFAERDVVFLMINSNLQDHRESIAAEAAEWGIDLPILVDEDQSIGESLALTRTAEALVLDPRWRVAYRGPINDRLSYERQRKAAEHHYLADALDSVLAGELPAVQAKDAIGCLINFPARRAASEKVERRVDSSPQDAGRAAPASRPNTAS